MPKDEPRFPPGFFFARTGPTLARGAHGGLGWPVAAPARPPACAPNVIGFARGSPKCGASVWCSVPLVPLIFARPSTRVNPGRAIPVGGYGGLRIGTIHTRLGSVRSFGGSVPHFSLSLQFFFLTRNPGRKAGNSRRTIPEPGAIPSAPNGYRSNRDFQRTQPTERHTPARHPGLTPATQAIPGLDNPIAQRGSNWYNTRVSGPWWPGRWAGAHERNEDERVS
jgi:hypothetical protein